MVTRVANYLRPQRPATVRWAGAAPPDGAPRPTRARRCCSTPPSSCSAPRAGRARRCGRSATRARLNPRYFYESFDDLDALLVAVYDRSVEELAASVLGRWSRRRRRPARPSAGRARARIVEFVDDDRRRGPCALRRGARQRGAQPAPHRDRPRARRAAGARPRPSATDRPPERASASADRGRLPRRRLRASCSAAWLGGPHRRVEAQLVDDAAPCSSRWATRRAELPPNAARTEETRLVRDTRPVLQNGDRPAR